MVRLVPRIQFLYSPVTVYDAAGNVTQVDDLVDRVTEPTAQLDRAMAASVVATLASLAQTDVIVVIATHDPQVRTQTTQVSGSRPDAHRRGAPNWGRLWG